jgi:hypothetical protein
VARLEHFTRAVQEEGIAQELDYALPPPLRRSVATKAVGLLRLGTQTITEFALDEDLVVQAP